METIVVGRPTITMDGNDKNYHKHKYIFRVHNSWIKLYERQTLWYVIVLFQWNGDSDQFKCVCSVFTLSSGCRWLAERARIRRIWMRDFQENTFFPCAHDPWIQCIFNAFRKIQTEEWKGNNLCFKTDWRILVILRVVFFFVSSLFHCCHCWNIVFTSTSIALNTMSTGGRF